MSAAITRNSSVVGPEGWRGRARIGDIVHPAHLPCRVQGADASLRWKCTRCSRPRTNRGRACDWHFHEARPRLPTGRRTRETSSRCSLTRFSAVEVERGSRYALKNWSPRGQSLDDDAQLQVQAGGSRMPSGLPQRSMNGARKRQPKKRSAKPSTFTPNFRRARRRWCCRHA
jgi:hypothetical protein